MNHKFNNFHYTEILVTISEPLFSIREGNPPFSVCTMKIGRIVIAPNVSVSFGYLLQDGASKDMLTVCLFLISDEYMLLDMLKNQGVDKK